MDSKYLALRDAGLTEGEIKVYLSLLRLGLSTTGNIVKESGVAKSFIYKILDNLIKKGLVSYITKDKTNYYQASTPEKILEYIEIKKQELDNSKKIIDDFLNSRFRNFLTVFRIQITGWFIR